MKSSDKNTTKQNPQRNALDFFAEAGLLKKIKRSGWWVVGIKEPESVAEHCFRCAVIGYYLAHVEGVDANKVVTMCLFNDIHEARINDLHKMGHYYIDFKQAESKVFKDQIAGLNENVAADMQKGRQEYEEQETKEAMIARDADILECLIQAKEYLDGGYPQAEKFFQKAPDHLHSQSAKDLWREAREWDSGAWWENVVKFDR